MSISFTCGLTCICDHYDRCQLCNNWWTFWTLREHLQLTFIHEFSSFWFSKHRYSCRNHCNYLRNVIHCRNRIRKWHVAVQLIAKCDILIPCMVCIKDLDKLNLVKIRNGGLVLDLSQFHYCPSCLKKLSLLQKWSKLTPK